MAAANSVLTHTGPDTQKLVGPAATSDAKTKQAKQAKELEGINHESQTKKHSDEKKRADDKTFNLSRKNEELGKKASDMEHQKMAVESSNEVKKMEIDKQRDDLSKKTDQHARMKEAAKREHENQMAHQKLDNAKQLDKTKLTQQGEIDTLNGTLKEKKKNIKELKEQVNAMKAKVAEEKRTLDQDIDKTKDEKKIEMEKKMAELEIDNHDKMNEKQLELKRAQEDLKTNEREVDMARAETEAKCEQQREDEKILREQTVNSMKEEFNMKDKDYQRQYTNKDMEHKAAIEDLNKKKESDFVHLRDMNRTELKELTNNYLKNSEDLTAQISRAKKELETAASEMEKEEFEHEHDLKIKMADQEREIEEAFLNEAKEKIIFWNNDVRMRKKLMEKTHEQLLAKVKFQIHEEEQKAKRAKDLNFELGRKVKRLESQMRQKDIHYRLKWFEDDKMIRDQVKRETITTLRDSESRHYD